MEKIFFLEILPFDLILELGKYLTDSEIDLVLNFRKSSFSQKEKEKIQIQAYNDYFIYRDYPKLYNIIIEYEKEGKGIVNRKLLKLELFRASKNTWSSTMCGSILLLGYIDKYSDLFYCNLMMASQLGIFEFVRVLMSRPEIDYLVGIQPQKIIQNVILYLIEGNQGELLLMIDLSFINVSHATGIWMTLNSWNEAAGKIKDTRILDWLDRHGFIKENILLQKARQYFNNYVIEWIIDHDYSTI